MDWYGSGVGHVTGNNVVMADSVNIDLMIPRIMANYKLHGPCTSGIAL